MSDLQHLIVPLNSAHIILLNILFLISILVFVSYSAILWGSTLISIIVNYLPVSEENKERLKEITSGFMEEKRIFGYILSFFPSFALLSILLQLLSQGHTDVYPLFIWVSVFMLVGQFFFFQYQNHHQSRLKNQTSTGLEYTQILAALLMLLAVWFVFSAFDGIIDMVRQEAAAPMMRYLFSMTTLLRVLTFALLSFSISSAFAMYKLSHAESDEFTSSKEALSSLAKITLAGLTTLPVWGTVAFFTFPHGVLSANLFLLLGISLVLSLILAVQYFIMTDFPSRKLAMSAFILYLVTLVPVFGADHIVIYNATAEPREKLLVIAEKMEKDEAGASTVVLSEKELYTQGEKIYNTICSACHQFDKRVVGPPYNTVLPKYVNDHAAMKSFILHPRKINEDYPPMPAQPLKPQQADAVITYLLTRLQNEKNAK